MLLCLWSLFLLLSACNSDRNQGADRLNDISYAFHYQSLDSVKAYADSVLNDKSLSSDAHAEAMNNLAFYYIGKMRYAIADSLLKKINASTDNQIELCIANIQQMHLCQRRSQNKAYYEFRQRALNNFKRLHEENKYTERQQKRIVYAETEFRLVSSVYDYYVGKTDDAIATLWELDSLGIQKKDTAQYLAYLYNIGAGGVLTHGTKEDIAQMEYNYLMQCFMMATEGGYKYWQANALQALSEHTLDDSGDFIYSNPSAMHYINIESVPDSLLAGNMAERSIALFKEYGNIYQQAASWRTLSRCYFNIKDYTGSVYALDEAVAVDTAVVQAPALMASLFELYSLSFSALDKKNESDYFRNKYLDLYDNTRQDRQLEARADSLSDQLKWLSILLHIIFVLIGILVIVLSYLVYRRMRKGTHENIGVSGTMRKIKEDNAAKLEVQEQLEEELSEKCGMMELQLSKQEREYAEQRAKMHLINSLTPLLDRMLHETQSLSQKDEPEDVRDDRMQYIAELIGRINTQNDFLTRWIQLKQGELSLHIESFSLQMLFDIVRKGAANFSRQDIELIVENTDETIKADKTLTLFMLNTLCDNARKFTPAGGKVTVSAKVVDDDMVEIGVEDTGSGMPAEVREHLFDVKVVNDEQLSDTESARKSSSHGFGLLNCKGIIEKYKKTNSLFARCNIDVESQEGRGTRFFFRLPRGVKKALILMAIFLPMLFSSASAHAASEKPLYSSLADSVYTCNVHARYSDAIQFASECFAEINKYYLATARNSTDTLLLYDPIVTVPAEVRWLRDSINAPFNIILSVRNETAVASLALHDWRLYRYNNSAYSSLFKELSADNSLASYCQRMQNTESNRNVAVILLVLLILSFIPIYYFTYYRHVILDFRKVINAMKQELAERTQHNVELQSKLDKLTFEHDRLHVINNVMSNSFSAIKHETMYFPSRIMQLVREVQMNDPATADYSQIDEVARYYRAIYDALSEQAQYNCRQQLPEATLRDIMLLCIGRLTGQRKADIKPSDTTAPFFVYREEMKQMPVRSAANSKDERDVNLKVLTQVVRDLGELYNLRRCGVLQEDNTLIVTAPSTLT